MSSFTQSLSQWRSSSIVLDTAAEATPIPSPTSTRPQRQRRLKFRASCDACAAAKIKCTKEHPVCTRCSVNGLKCIYGVSRKHGKPRRTRTRNPDESPCSNMSKQRLSLDGSEFGKFRIRWESGIRSLPELDTPVSNWSPAQSASNTTDLDFEMTPRTACSFTDGLLSNTQSTTENQALAFPDSFVEDQEVQLNTQNVKDQSKLTSNITMYPLDYELKVSLVDTGSSSYSFLSPQSPNAEQISSHGTTTGSLPTPTSNCCYPLAYSTLESLRIINSNAAYSNIELESVVSITNLAVQNVLQLVGCPCSLDPHLAMLYSSITSRILHLYQTIAGTNWNTSQSTASSPFLGHCFTLPTSSIFTSPLASPGSEVSTFGSQTQPLNFELYGGFQAEQLRRQMILGGLAACEQLVDALVGWTGCGGAEQAGFLYSVLGAWLKSELFRVAREVEGGMEEL